MTPRGAFITVEGGEGVGKTTSLDAIRETLVAGGIRVTTTREPGGTSLGESVRAWILEGDHGPLSAEVEALLMFAARAWHIDRVIRPALERGEWVLCDRFTDATFAYQGGGRGADAAFLRNLAEHVQREIVPDLTILLDAPVEVGMSRIADRPHDHFEREAADFFERVRRAYLDLAAEDPERIRIIDASADPAAVHSAIAGTLEAFCRQFALPSRAAR